MANELIAWIFTFGAIISYLILAGHCYIYHKKPLTYFLFLGGGLISFLLEYTLSIQEEQYSYQNLPLVIYGIPISIPMGWVITVYGLYNFTISLLTDEKQTTLNVVLLNGFLAGLFGLGIENLARSIEFWDFHFVSIKYFGIPVIVTLAWGLSVMVFTLSLKLFQNKPEFWYLYLPIAHILNLFIAFILISL